MRVSDVIAKKGASKHADQNDLLYCKHWSIMYYTYLWPPFQTGLNSIFTYWASTVNGQQAKACDLAYSPWSKWMVVLWFFLKSTNQQLWIIYDWLLMIMHVQVVTFNYLTCDKGPTSSQGPFLMVGWLKANHSPPFPFKVFKCICNQCFSHWHCWLSNAT